ncbi:MAG TPA: FAD-dependent oxidoreductase, partial [Acidimicrobiales bacterium]|nr:FAD-dependent oxidoreductase [Acidimicrobiales bacterium]
MDRERIEEACAAAEVHPLLCAVAEVTGDLSLLRDEFVPDQWQLFLPGAGLGPGQQAEARRLAAAALGAHRDSGAADRVLADGELRRAYAFLAAGAHRAERWEAFLTEELAPAGTDPRRPSWHTSELGRPFRCAVVGAGASGITAAHRLRQAGVAVTVYEKNPEVGGTWLENVYPGCRVDVPNQLYSFSFAQTNDWTSRFSAQPDLLAYLQGVAEELGLGDCIEFGCEVTEARFDEAEALWTLTARRADGTEQADAFDAVVCAVGQLNRPSFPDIGGRQEFGGP